VVLKDEEAFLLVGTASVNVVSASLNGVLDSVPELASMVIDVVMVPSSEVTGVGTSTIVVSDSGGSPVDRETLVESGTPVERAISEEGITRLELLLAPYGG
jgi:hypothetical protein